MPEVQKHGFAFEDWIKTTFFEAYSKTSYTDKWDAVNIVFKSKFTEYSANLNALPVSIKTCRYGSPINFGDALRQFENTQDFLLFAGFWMASGIGKKFVAAKAVQISAAKWHHLFDKAVTPHELKKDELVGNGVEEKLYKLDSTIKNTFHYRVARQKAKDEKKEFPMMDIVLNPKIDSKQQRRLQCSLPFQTFWDKFANEPPSIKQICELWGEVIPDL